MVLAILCDKKKKKNTCKEKQINLDSTCVLFDTVIIMFCIVFLIVSSYLKMDVFSFLSFSQKKNK